MRIFLYLIYGIRESTGIYNFARNRNLINKVIKVPKYPVPEIF